MITQGETRDFLHFLRRIKYDHRQCPQNDGNLKNKIIFYNFKIFLLFR